MSKSDRLRALLRERYPDGKVPYGLSGALADEVDLSQTGVLDIMRCAGFVIDRDYGLCVHGHPRVEGNLYYTTTVTGKRWAACKTCVKAAKTEQTLRRRAS